MFIFFRVHIAKDNACIAKSNAYVAKNNACIVKSNAYIVKNNIGTWKPCTDKFRFTL